MFNRAHLVDIVQRALREDGPYDITTLSLSPRSQREIEGQIVSQQDGIICGMDCAALAINLCDPTCIFKPHFEDGDMVYSGDIIASLKGKPHSLLMAERVSLNFLIYLSGISTLTHKYCSLIKKYPAKIASTRKTIPGMRSLSKYAVYKGGGCFHRNSLSEVILIKDNHMSLLEKNLLTEDKKSFIKQLHHHYVIVEIDNINQIDRALSYRPNTILCDNMKPEHVEVCVNLSKKFSFFVEVSGGVTLENVQDFASLGVHFISIGRLTLCPLYFDISCLIMN